MAAFKFKFVTPTGTAAAVTVTHVIVAYCGGWELELGGGVGCGGLLWDSEGALRRGWAGAGSSLRFCLPRALTHRDGRHGGTLGDYY